MASSTALDISMYSLFSFLGTFGVAITGFGMAIIYLFFWQIAVLAGYSSDFKYAIFIQALSLLCAQPLMVYKTKLWKFASKEMLLYFVPITILSTPLGQYTADHIDTYVVEMIGGFLVTFVAIFEIFQRRQMFLEWARCVIRKVTCGQCFAKKEGTEEKEKKGADDQLEGHAEENGSEQKLEVDENENEKGNDCDCPAEVDSSREQEAQNVTTTNENSAIPESDNLESQQENDSSKQEGHTAEPYTFSTIFWTLFAGFLSGYLGGLCGIRGPPIIIFFLHLPSPIVFKNKQEQRATGASITLTNVVMRIVYYIVNTVVFDKHSYFAGEDWGLYLSVAIFSLLGVLGGAKVFDLISDKKDTIKGILTIFLVLCGISLLISSFVNLK